MAAITLIAMLVMVAYIFLWILLNVTHDRREPPAVQTALPFIGSVIDIGWRGLEYWSIKTASVPIYTMRLPGTRIYIVNETALIPVVQKHIKSLSFSPILVDMSARVVGVSKETWEIIKNDYMDDNSLISGMHNATHHALSPSSRLDVLTKRAARLVHNSLDIYAAQNSVTVSLKAWVDHEIISSTTDCIYGPLNPFRDPNVEAVWYDYETGLLPLLISVFPSLTAAKHVRARQVLVEAFETYFEKIGHANSSDVSPLIAKRVKLYEQNGIPIQDIARIEVGQALGLISNMKPAAFWLLYQVFSDDSALEECRAEISNICDEQNGVCVINTGHLSQSCPILASAFQETLRVHGTGVSPRMVVEDEILDGKYLLKKGSIVLIPAWVQHHDKGNWGDAVTTFDHRRFLRESSKRRGYKPIAFRGFGGGSTLCPGRHFATAHVLALAALLISRFNMRPVDGEWAYPKTAKSKPGIAVHQPDGDIRVTISCRDHKQWRVQS